MSVCIGILYYFSSTANPILYNLMSRKFRAAFRRTVCCWFECGSCGRNTRTLIPVAPAPVVCDGAGHQRVPPRRLGNAVMPTDHDTAADNDGLLHQTQVRLAHYTSAVVNIATFWWLSWSSNKGSDISF